MQQPSPSQIKEQINAIIEDHLAQHQHLADQIDPQYARLWQAIRQLMSSGGKRLRPYLVCLSYATFSHTDHQPAAILEVAAAQELLHFALLAHDDIIDRDLIRYGSANINGQYQKHYQPLANSQVDTEHYANGSAILAGDLMIGLAFQLINQADLNPHQKAVAITNLNAAIFRVAGGELLDMEGGLSRQSSVDYFKVAHYKTASYSFIGPLATGAQLAQASPTQLAALEEYGLNLGIAYQLTDDLLGVYGDQATTGKPITSDLREGKKTHFFSLIQERATPSEGAFFDQVWGHPQVQIADVERVRQIGDRSGAKAQVEQLINDYAAQAQAALDQLRLTSPQVQPYLDLINSCIKRDK